MSVVATLLADTDGFGHMNGWDGGWMWLWGVAMMVPFVVLIVWVLPRQRRCRPNHTPGFTGAH